MTSTETEFLVELLFMLLLLATPAISVTTVALYDAWQCERKDRRR